MTVAIPGGTRIRQALYRYGPAGDVAGLGRESDSEFYDRPVGVCKLQSIFLALYLCKGLLWRIAELKFYDIGVVAHS